MKNIFKISLFFSVLFSNVLFSQEDNLMPQKFTSSNKGKFYLYWGGNRGIFTNSDIRFKGNDYDFTIKDVEAKDRPKGWHIDYINPLRMTIPQTNFRLGYYITDHYNVSVGVDHMKYVMVQEQEVALDGNYPNKGSYGELLPDGKVKLTEKFLTFEHTDGLNYVNTEINRVDDISSLFSIRDTDKLQINLTGGVGAGVLFPKSNTQLMQKERYDEFHIAGFGLSAKAGLNITFYKYFFIQGELKGGYINMPDIRTTYNKDDRASQSFWFGESVIAVGGIFRLF